MAISKNLKIGLIIGGVAVVGLVIFVMLKKRKSAKEEAEAEEDKPSKEDEPVKIEDIDMDKVVYSKKGTNVREGADKSYAVWSKIEKAGVALPVLSYIYPPVVDGQYTWVFIQTPDYKHVGWVRSDAVSLTPPKK